MKLSKHAPVLAFLFLTPTCFASVSHVQQASSSVWTNQWRSSSTVSFSSPTTAGNAIIVSLTYGNANPTITATDAQGNTYQEALQTYDSANSKGVAIFYATNIKGGADTITISYSQPVAWVVLAVHEYSGLANALDVGTGSVGNSTSPSSGSATTTANGDLTFGTMVVTKGTFTTLTAGTGFTTRMDLGSTTGFIDEDEVQSLAGSIAATWTVSPAVNWAAAMATFKASNGTEPRINSLSPTQGGTGTAVTITGTNFGATQGTSTVMFNGTTATPTTWSATGIVAPVPVGATSGNVVVAVSGVQSNPFRFTALPSGWSDTDVGTVGPIGGAGYSSGTFTVQGGGSGVGNFEDSFHFAYQALSGDGTIVARVASLQGGRTVESAGVMIRETLDITSNNVYANFQSPNSYFAYRTNGGSATIATGGSASLPYWVKAVRSGSTFSGYTASDGINWVQIGASQTISMVQNVYIGLGVASGSTAAPSNFATATFDNVSITAGAGTGPSITSLSPTSGSSGTSATITGTNFGATQGTSTVTFNGTTATPTSWSATSIVVAVPSGATTGNVVVTVSGVASNGLTFTVTPPNAITHVQQASSSVMTSTLRSSSSVSFTNAITAGNAIIVDVTYGISPSDTTMTATDSQGNTFQKAVQTYDPGTGDHQGVAIFYATNIKGGADTVTISFTSQVAWVVLGIHEYGGLGNALDVSAGSLGSGTSPSSGSAVTTANGDLIFGCVMEVVNGTGDTYTAGSGFAKRIDLGASSGFADEDQIQSSAGSIAANWTMSPSGKNWVAVMAAFKASTGAGPSITSLLPTQGTIGTSVTIAGSNFGGTQGSSTVKFNGTTATPTSWSATSIVVAVPSGATTGNVVVTVSGVASNGLTFTVNPAPIITSISPTSGPVGTSVTITGTNFGATQGTSTVSFNGTIVGVLASDNFNRANANPIGTPWTAATGSIQLLGNAVAPATITPQFNSILYSGVTWPADQSVQATLLQLRPKSGYPALVLRSDGTAQNFYYIDLDASPGFGGAGLSTPLNLQKVVGGVLQPPEYYGYGYITPQVNDTFRAQIVGATISVFQNGTLIGSFTDPSPIASGSPGLFLQPDASTASVTDLSWGNFFAGSATTTSWSNTSIVTAVPLGATTGSVVVIVGGVKSNAVTFTVTSPTPSITGLSPSTGPVGTSVTITGTNFGTAQGTSTVKFNGTVAVPTSWSATSIVAPVPSGATTGNVVVAVSGVASNGVAFTVNPAPSITSLSPTSGPVGASVTITGTNFGATQGTSTVTFNGTTGTPTSWSATSIVVPVPSAATTGNVMVTVGGVASNVVSFTVAPTISNLSPTTGVPGTAVTISGFGFGATQGTNSVAFNGAAAVASNWSDTQVQVLVPPGATTGNVTVTASGLPSNGSPFTVTNAFASAGNLQVPRAGHTATLLNNGLVLIAGGANGTQFLASAELYNPSTGAFTSTGSMAASRIAHSATLLSNGTVLFIGGYNSNGWLGSAEIYNPATGTFSLTGSLATARDYHTATLLANGMVLVAGGANSAGVLATAELYNPGSGTFSATGNLITARDNHSSTLLNDGTVLVASGSGVTGDLASAELYNPAAGAFSVVGALNTARSHHTATLLNNGSVILAGGSSSIGILAGVELYDPASASFTVIANLNVARSYHTATLLNNGTVLFVAGSGASSVLASAELYDPGTGMLTIAGNLNTARALHTATLLANGSILISGGNGTSGTVASAELYQPSGLTPAGLVSITVNPANPTIPAGGAQRFTATGTFADNSNQTLLSATWSSSSTTVATISNDPSDFGTAYAVRTGSTTISACTGSICGSSMVTVNPGPSIATLSPTAGVAGASVTITGANFGTTQGTNLVLFNGINAAVASWTSTSIIAAVPIGATTGNVVVTVDGIASNGSNFAVTASSSPGITTITPSSAPSGAWVTIAGANFGSTQGSSVVTFNGVSASATSWNATNIQVSVPMGATTGNVVVTVAGIASNGLNFTVIPSSSPSIANLSPPAGPVGMSVTISGTNFGSSQGGGGVVFNGVPATPSGSSGTCSSSWSNSCIVVSVPAGAASGNVVVTNASGSVTNGVPFTVTAPAAFISGPSLVLQQGDGATATMLNNGMVLIVGGQNSSGFSGNAELYNPSTQQFSATGSLITPRAYHTATLLNNGMVLVTGGSNNGNLTTSELYNPATGTFSTTGSLNSGRADHTATLLTNGKVLVAGGGAQYYLASAEIYDPAAGIFTVTGSMAAARSGHTATLLNTGNVLVAAGFNGSYLSGAELYNPATGTFTATGTLGTPREFHTATLLTNGTVLICGGLYSGGTQTTFVQGTELYNASTGTFTTSGNMTIGRSSHTATLLSDGSVLVTGGNYFAGKTATAEVYDSVAGTFAPVGSMTEARVGHTATLLNNGLVLIVGGAYPDTQSSELYQPTTAPRIATISPTFGSTGTVVSIAGINFGSTQGSSTVQFGSVTASPTSWSKTQIVVPVPPGIFAVHTQIIVTVKGVVSNSASFLMPPQISGILPAAGPIGVTTTITGVGFGLSAGTVQFNGTAATPKLWSDNQIVVPVPTGAATGNVSVTVSGVTSNPVAFTVDSPGTSSYTGSMLQPWSFPLTQTATVLNNGMVLIIGGGNGTDAELYNPSTGTFTETGSLNNARTYFTATLLSNGMVLVAGGRVYNSSFTTITSAELYNPTTGTFTNTGGLNMRRAQHTATLLNNGMVLIAGGRGDYTTTVPTDVTQAELYNPATGSFALTGSLNIARMGHTATLLGNNQVIIMGGWNDGPNSSTEGFVGVSELYNPATGVFTSTTELNTWRYNHTATVLSNGKILIVGGILGYSSSGYICYPTCPPSELYDPVANQFSNSGFLITQRENHTATLLSSGNVLVTGGDNGQPFGSPYYQALANVEIYNLSSGTFAAGENLNVARSGHTATLLSNGEVLIAGGDVNGIAELYQVSQTAIPGQPSAPSNLAASAVSNSQINLSWTAPTSGSGLSYVIFRNGIPIASNVPVTSYQDTGLISNTTYSYQVEAMASSGTLSGESLASNSVVATTIPSAPTNLTATPVSSAQINLSWTASAGPGLTYTLLRNGSPIATGMTGTSYSDSGLAGAARYSYEVEAVNLSGTSAPSNIANVTQPTVFGTSPAGAPSGSLITIEGEDFGSAQGSVFIGGNAAAVQVWGSTAIVVVVPTALPPGLVGVQVANFQGASNVVPFTITVAGCPTN